MSVSNQKKQTLSRYIKDYKHSQIHCAQCNKILHRILLVFNDQILNKKSISAMTEMVDWKA